MIPTHLQERIERLMREQHLTYSEAWATLSHDPEFRPIFEAMEGESKTRCNGPAHPGRFSTLEEFNARTKTTHGGSGATYLANLRQNHNQQTNTERPNMKDPGSVPARTAIIQEWIAAALKDDPKLTYQQAWNTAEKEPELTPLFAAMIHSAAVTREGAFSDYTAAGGGRSSDGLSSGAIRGPDMSKLSLGKQPDPGSRDKDGYPSGFAAGPAINALRAATGNKISQHPG